MSRSADKTTSSTNAKRAYRKGKPMSASERQLAAIARKRETHFQRVPTVDTSNPFAAKAIPSLDESFVVIHFRNLQNIDFPWLLAMLQGSFISHMNTLVVPGGKMGLAMELIMTPLVERLMEGRKIG